MTRNHASLQREPFLTPIWLTVVGVLFGMALLVFAVWIWATANSTTVVVVRGAESAEAGADAPLAPAGETRAALLSRMFGDPRASGRIDAIYVLPGLRNRLTAAPLSARLALPPIPLAADDARGVARRVLRDHSGGRVLVVAPKGAVDDIVQALSEKDHLPPISDEDYGAMYVISVPRIGRPNLLRLTY